MINCTFEDGGKGSLRHAVVDAIVVKDKKILLVKRAARLTNGGKWAIPGGFLDRDETLEHAIVRELKEETGLKGKVVKLFRVVDDPNRKNEDRQNVAFIYILEATGEISVDPEEVSEAKWFDINNLPKEKDFAFDHFETISQYKNEESNN